MTESSEKRPYLLRIIGTWASFLATATLLSIPAGPIPPLGEFLSPATGYLRNAIPGEKISTPQTLQAKGLRAPVSIAIDTRGVPHVTAQNDADLAFGQGYVTARDRLWQMELQTAATAGWVAKILGPKAVNYDIAQRKMGFLAAAEAEIEFLKKNDPEQYEILIAYSNGVNTYIRSLKPENYPIEYKLLGTAPELWSPLKCALFHKQMSWTLTGHFDDFKFSNALQKFSKTELENLFPEFHAASSPILDESINQMSTARLEGFTSTTAPFQLDGILSVGESSGAEKKSSSSGSHGSNNWVVDGVHTSHSYPVLANDPHLDLKLPSIWYEIQLTAPGVNVYGATLPGLPHVIIGFNESVSWGITNAGVDVLDWYAMKFDKTKPAPRYLNGARWRDSQIKKETIEIKGQPSQTIEVIQTHIGPIAKEIDLEKKSGGTVRIPFAMKWTGHAPSNEYRVFYDANRARTVRDLKNALRSYETPGQNFVLADITGSIGYVQAGRFPMRKSGHGRYVLDGTLPTDEWREFIPFSHLPQSWSPERGYLATANQQPTFEAPAGYASGDWGFTSYLRGARIHEQLASLTSSTPMTIGALMGLQNDVFDLRAKKLLPLLLPWIKNQLKTSESQKAFQLLSHWDYQLTPNSIAAALWSEWWETFHNTLWQEAFPEPLFKHPSEDRSMDLVLNRSEMDWPNHPDVPKISALPDIASRSFLRSIEALKIVAKRNSLQELPSWSVFRGTDIPHLANLSGFGLTQLPTGGNGHTVNAITRKHGPSWRMVVTWVDAQPKAWGIYPGGQSGHVGSPYYKNMIGKWLKGELDELLFVKQGTLKEALTLERIRLEIDK